MGSLPTEIALISALQALCKNSSSGPAEEQPAAILTRRLRWVPHRRDDRYGQPIGCSDVSLYPTSRRKKDSLLHACTHSRAAVMMPLDQGR